MCARWTVEVVSEVSMFNVHQAPLELVGQSRLPSPASIPQYRATSTSIYMYVCYCYWSSVVRFDHSLALDNCAHPGVMVGNGLGTTALFSIFCSDRSQGTELDSQHGDPCATL